MATVERDRGGGDCRERGRKWEEDDDEVDRSKERVLRVDG